MGKVKNKPKQTFNYSPGKGLTVRLRGKKISGGKISLYLEYYRGYSKDESGKIKPIRKKEVLKLYLKEHPGTPDERKKNNENLLLAQGIRSTRETDINHSKEGFISPNKKKINFYDYCQTYIEQYDKKDIRMIKGAVKLFFDHVGEKFILPIQVDEKLIEGFKGLLEKKYKGETPRSYFARFKKILTAATKDKIFTASPANGIVCKSPDGIPKEILMPDEIVSLSNAYCGNEEVKRAFLLSLNTGLRFVDVEDLKYCHIKNGQINKKQSKTGREVIIDLNANALNLIGKHGKPDEKVFTLPSFTACLSDIKNWAKRAEITKNITWHSARHSFGTILMMNNTDIVTVKNLLGHSKLEHTQKYTHLVDDLRKKAVNQLPDISI